MKLAILNRILKSTDMMKILWTQNILRLLYKYLQLENQISKEKIIISIINFDIKQCIVLTYNFK